MITVDNKIIPDRIKYYILAHLDDTGKRYAEKSVNSMTSKEMLELFERLCKDDLREMK